MSASPKTNVKAIDKQSAFTLLELLIVMGLVAVLAWPTFTSLKAINRERIRSRLRTELTQIATAIELYKDRRGSYPPDNPGNPAVNPLYFELIGTTISNGVYLTLDGSAKIDQLDLSSPPPTGFGPGVSAFSNSIRSGPGEDRPAAKNYLPGLKPAQIGELAPGFKLLAGSVPWPTSTTPAPTLNPSLDPGATSPRIPSTIQTPSTCGWM